MLIIKRYLSFFLGLVTCVFLEIFIFFSQMIADKLVLYKVIFIFGLLYIVLLFSCLWYLQAGKLQDIKKRVVYFVLPVVLIINWVYFLIYLNFGRFFLHLFVVLLGVVVWLYIESFFLKYYFVRFYKPHSFENMVEEISVLVSFLFFVNFFSFRVYMGWNYYTLFILAGIVLFLLVLSQFIFNDFFIKKIFLIYLLAIPFLSIQLLFVSTFLPTNFYSIALINTLFFYLFIIFTRHHLMEKFSAKMARRYLSLSVVLLIFILIISRWT